MNQYDDAEFWEKVWPDIKEFFEERSDDFEYITNNFYLEDEYITITYDFLANDFFCESTSDIEKMGGSGRDKELKDRIKSDERLNKIIEDFFQSGYVNQINIEIGDNNWLSIQVNKNTTAYNIVFSEIIYERTRYNNPKSVIFEGCVLVVELIV
ncbi:hypothetical protein LJC58_09330, partial [Lachnospiraceae bacterium OttesenSCG-928-D06]|nr:hypothetical protein [Lachnospiraceae bacterium OttesenSCG-928-D06]